MGNTAVGRSREGPQPAADVAPTYDVALSPSERRVAELAASGMSNRVVAAALFISPKTVEATLAGFITSSASSRAPSSAASSTIYGIRSDAHPVCHRSTGNPVIIAACGALHLPRRGSCRRLPATNRVVSHGPYPRSIPAWNRVSRWTSRCHPKDELRRHTNHAAQALAHEAHPGGGGGRHWRTLLPAVEPQPPGRVHAEKKRTRCHEARFRLSDSWVSP